MLPPTIRELLRELKDPSSHALYHACVKTWAPGADVAQVTRYFERRGLRVSATQAGPKPHNWGPEDNVLIKVSWEHAVATEDLIADILGGTLGT